MIGITLLVILVFFFIISFLYQLSGDIFVNKYKKIENDYNTNLSHKSIFLLCIAITLLVFAVIAVIIFTRESVYDHFASDKSGYIGDTIGGITNPFINSAAVIVTGLAFYMQYKANKLQVHLFKEQLDEAKKQFEADQLNQRQKNQIEQIETRFYEMLKLHKSNIDELHYSGYDTTSTGRKAFEDLNYELKKIYNTVSVHSIYSNNLNQKEKLLIAYRIFFYGIYNEQNKLFTNVQLKKIFVDNFSHAIFDEVSGYVIPNGTSFGAGHSSELSHIYRHLFLTVKFIVSQPKALITYEEKRGYLRILRAQLSNHEQAMLFYNWYGGFGERWEEDFDTGNKFFTDFRMIHNLYNEILHKEFRLDIIFDLNKTINVEKNRNDDFLFEFQS